MSGKSSENYLDYLLESINSGTGNPYEEEPEEQEEQEEQDIQDSELEKLNIVFEEEEPQLTSDDEFIQSFERELESDAYRDYFADFESDMGQQKAHQVAFDDSFGDIPDDLDSFMQDIEMHSQDETFDDFSFMDDDVNLYSQDDLADELSVKSDDEQSKKNSQQKELKTAASQNDKTGQQEELYVDNLQNELTDDLGLLGLEEIKEPGAEPTALAQEPKLTEDGEPDLAGMSDEDLIHMLAKAEGLADIGEILSDSESGNATGSEEIDAFASNEMKKQEAEAENTDGLQETDAKEKKKTKGKLSDFFKKMKLMLFGKDEEEDATKDKKESSEPNGDSLGQISELTEENQQILMELAADEEADGKKGKKEKKAKEKKPKEKKAKEKKPQKPKKEKKPKEKDNTPPLPKVPVFLCFVMAASFVALVIFATSTVGYSTKLSVAKAAFDNQDYTRAYQNLEGMSMKKKDELLYNQVTVLARVDSEYQAYGVFKLYGNHEAALDSLVCAAGRVALNSEKAQEYECISQMECLSLAIADDLQTNYGMNLEEAQNIYNVKSRQEYSILIHKKLIELGLE